MKVEAYKKTVDIEENKTLTDAATGKLLATASGSWMPL